MQCVCYVAGVACVCLCEIGEGRTESSPVISVSLPKYANRVFADLVGRTETRKVVHDTARPSKLEQIQVFNCEKDRMPIRWAKPSSTGLPPIRTVVDPRRGREVIGCVWPGDAHLAVQISK
jgi:hypothetical protein